jgi:hypothetical protein
MNLGDNDMVSVSDYAGLSLQSYENPIDGVSDSTIALRLADTSFASDATDAGFYGTAYHIDGKVDIAYRGTDQPLDVFEGWSTGAGFVNQPQAHLAVRFYQAVVAQFPASK